MAASNDEAYDRGKVEHFVTVLKGIRWREVGHVAVLVETPEPGRHVDREDVKAVVGRGFAGDHARKSYFKGKHVPGREVSAIALEVLQVLGVDPVVVGDNLITEGIDLGALEEGDRLRVGDVVLERSGKAHRPCTTFRDRTSPEAFAVVSRDRYRGALFVVCEGGTIRRGEAIQRC